MSKTRPKVATVPKWEPYRTKRQCWLAGMDAKARARNRAKKPRD